MAKKKHIVTKLCFTLGLGAMFVSSLASCNSSENVDVDSLKVVLTGARNGVAGDTFKLNTMVIGDSSNSVTFRSDNPSIAKVDESGNVTLMNPGVANITATSTKNVGAYASVEVRVYSNEEATKKLEIVSLPTVTKYKKGAKFSLEGLVVSGVLYVGQVKDYDHVTNFENSELTFSVEEGSALNTLGDIEVTVSHNGYESTTFKINVANVVTTTRLYVYKNPNKTKYILPSGNDQSVAFSTQGLQVRKLTYKDGEYSSYQALNETDYSLSITNGTLLTKEGSYEIKVTLNDNEEGCLDTSFNIIVYTQDLSVYRLIQNLQTSHNFQVEILNNVGTTRDETGFHYLRTYTEEYYDEITYQNKTNTSGEIEFSTTNIKEHIGYTTYEDGDEYGILQYKENNIGDIEGDTIITQGKRSWWDKAATLTKLFDTFNLDDIPTETLNGKFLVLSIEQAANDNEDGDLTIKKYPLVASFLDYVGWSSSLITIMSRFTITIDGDYNLSMKASFGSYGYTEMKVTAVGNAKAEAEDYILSGLVPNKTVASEVKTLAQAFKNNNYTLHKYDSSSGIAEATGYITENYNYSISNNAGIAKIGNDLYNFTGKKSGKVMTFQLGEKIEGETDIVTYTNAHKGSGGVGYLSNFFGDSLDPDNANNELYTLSKYEGFSSETEICYQSFNQTFINNFYYFTRGSNEEQPEDGYRYWMLTHYFNDSDFNDIENINQVEVWDINFTGSGGSGVVIPYGEFGKTSVEWIENGIAAALSDLQD